jgi:DNA-binding NarL/FixJ family response regulator
VLRDVSAGVRLVNIADKYGLEDQTVRKYMTTIYDKLDAYLPTPSLQGAGFAFNKWLAAGYVPPPDLDDPAVDREDD